MSLHPRARAWIIVEQALSTSMTTTLLPVSFIRPDSDGVNDRSIFKKFPVRRPPYLKRPL
jgi:hypothetical protein